MPGARPPIAAGDRRRDNRPTMTPPSLDLALAARLAAVALANVEREYPATSSTTCWTATATRPRRARCIRRSTAASTGTRACTCTGCWRRCAGASRACRSAPRSTRVFDRHLDAGRDRRRVRVPRAPGRRSRSSAPTAGRGCSSSRTSSAAPTTPWPAAGRRRSPRSPTRSSAATVDYLPRRSYPIRHGHASEQRVRARVRARLRALRGERGGLAAVLRRRRCRWFGARPRRAGRLGAFGRGLPVAGARRGRPDAPRAARPRVRARGSSASCRGSRRGEPAALFAPVAGQRPQRSADRAPRRPQPVARVVLARASPRALPAADPRTTRWRRRRRVPPRRRLRRARERRLRGRALARHASRCWRCARRAAPAAVGC